MSRRFLQDVLGIGYKYYHLKNKKKLPINNQCSLRALVKVSGDEVNNVYKNLYKTAEKYNDFPDNVTIIKKTAKKYYRMSGLNMDEYPLVATFCSEHKMGSFIIFIQSHCFAYVNGVIYDSISNGDKCTKETIEWVLTQDILDVIKK